MPNYIGTFTGDLTGNVTGNVTGNLTGNLTGNCTGNVAGTASVATTVTSLSTHVAADLANGTTGSGLIVLSTGPSFTAGIGLDGMAAKSHAIAFSTGGATPSSTSSALYSPNGTDLYFNGTILSAGSPGSSINITDDTTTNTTVYPAWTTATSGAITAEKVSSTKLSFNPSTGLLSTVGVSLSGTLGVTGVSTFTAQPIVSSLTASRAVFTDGSKGLVSNAITGTGNVVMSASPTMTGTVTVAGVKVASNSVAANADYTVDTGVVDYLIVCNNTVSTKTVTLVAPSATGRVLVIKNIGAGSVTVSGTNIFTASTVSSIVLVKGDSVTLIADGTNWIVS